jgi:ABC-2 type transport system permease protein
VSYWSIAGEREEGSLKLLLGLPTTRRAVVTGKFLGRTVVVTVAILLGFAVAGGIALATYGTFDAAAFASYTALTVLYGAVYVAIGLGFSAWMPSRFRAIAGAASLYFLFLLGWDLVLAVLVALSGRSVTQDAVPGWIQFVGALNPASAFVYAVRSLVPEYVAVTTLPAAEGAGLQNWAGFVILAAWILVPLGLGLLRFSRADL